MNNTSSGSLTTFAPTRPASAVSSLSNAVQVSGSAIAGREKVVERATVGREGMTKRVNFLNRGVAMVLSVGMILLNSAWANVAWILESFPQTDRFRTVSC